MILLSVPWYVAAVYWVGFVLCWRSLTGHVAWSMHRSAKTQPTLRPPVENWLGAAIPCAALSLLWPAVMLFSVPWPWVKGAERDGEIELRRVQFKQLEESGLRHEQISEASWDSQFAPEKLRGNVVDG